MRNVVGFDTETKLIRKFHVIPELICGTFYIDGQADLLGNGDDPELYDKIRWMFESDYVITGLNIGYDCAVVAKEYPDLYPTIFEKYEAGQIVCIGIRQKLLDLSTTGDIETKRYNLNAIGLRYGLTDKKEEKEGEDSVRLRFAEMDGRKGVEYPDEFRDYALRDAEEPVEIYLKQAQAKGSTATDAFHSAADFCFQLITAEGMITDAERVKKLDALIKDRLSPKNMRTLYDAGILRPAVLPRPYKNGKGYTKGKKESVNKSVLQAKVAEVCENHGLEVPKTEPSAKFPSGQIKTSSSVFAKLVNKDSALEKFAERQKLDKLRSTYLPNLKQGICYFGFNPLVSTGRASSVGSKMYPSMNGQNQPRNTGELSIRECFVPRPGNLFLAIDVSALELCSLAQQTYDLFGRSVHREKINAGFDLHAFLGSQIAYRWDKYFRETCEEAEWQEADDIYQFFLHLKKTDYLFYDRFRTIAKPTGLGYPGGLGPKTFIDFCFTAYGLEITLEEATELRDMWFMVYPEMREFFAWVNQQFDPNNYGLYRYTSPLGMVRAGATFTATANGAGLQTPSAEAVKMAVIRLVRACYDYTVDSPMYGCRVVNEIHDEIIWEIPADSMTNERRLWCQKVFRDSLQHLFPDVTMSTEAVLMDRWYKQAKPTFDEQGRLIPWQPKPSLN